MNRILLAFAFLLIAVNASAQTATQTATFTVNWNDPNSGVAQEDGYRVDRASASAGPFAAAATLKPDAVTFVDAIANDPGGTTRCFRVQAVKTVGNGPISNVACGTTPVISVAPNGAITVNVNVSVTVTTVP